MIYWNHNIRHPHFYKKCRCGELIGPFHKLAEAESAYEHEQHEPSRRDRDEALENHWDQREHYKEGM